MFRSACAAFERTNIHVTLSYFQSLSVSQMNSGVAAKFTSASVIYSSATASKTAPMDMMKVKLPAAVR